MRRSEKAMHPSLKKQIRDIFMQTIADMRDIEEANRFFKDFFTDSEMEVFSKRLAVAYWLKKGRSYANIKENLQVSSATIASIQDTMKKAGFALAVRKIEAEEWANIWSEKIKKFVGKKNK